MDYGPQVGFSQELHAQKYRGPGESFREMCNRLALAMSDDTDHYHAFRDILLEMRFLPAGRVQAAMGSPRAVTPINCYVSGTIEDSFVEGSGSIMERAKEAAATMRQGGGIGFDFSTLRPRGFFIKTLDSQASGPVSFMEIFNSVGQTVASAGHRRGAMMAVLRVDHPDVEEFIRAKQPSAEAEGLLAHMDSLPRGSSEWNTFNRALQKTLRLTGFNVSLAVTDEFMRAVEAGTDFQLRFGNRAFRTVDARGLWEMIMRSTWDWAEPGVLFIDQINRMNNLHYCETIAATNPCGEQPLPPFGACLLGSFNLPKYVREPNVFDYEQFRKDIHVVVQAMDNVVERARYPIYEQKKEQQQKRRMGLGVTGLANAIEFMLGQPCYGSEEFLNKQKWILATLRDESYKASALIAEKKGSFHLYDRDAYMSGRFIGTLPNEVRDLIAAHGIRNSHLTSIAPTGTISLCADNVSSGIEPVFGYQFQRTVQEFAGSRDEIVEDYGVRVWNMYGKVASEVTGQEHLNVLATAQQFVDSAVSKTCNVSPSMEWADFKNLYFQAWKAGCKGCTTFQIGGRRTGVLQEIDSACFIDPETGQKECG